MAVDRVRKHDKAQLFIKALCVHLTEEGYSTLKNYYEGAKDRFVDYASERKHDSTRKFYCQIPFRISNVLSVVSDLRGKGEVEGQLNAFITSGYARNCWKVY